MPTRRVLLLGIVPALAIAVACSDSKESPSGGSSPDGGGSSGANPPGANPPGSNPPGQNGDSGTDYDWAPPAVKPNGPPVETADPNATGQTPAFPEQTRAPGHPTNVAFDVKERGTGLGVVWAMAILADDAILVTQRSGSMRIIAPNGDVSAPLGGVPAVGAVSQGGLLDVVLDPDFAQSSRIHFTYAEPRAGQYGLVVARAVLVREDPPRLTDVQTVWSMPQSSGSPIHYGGRIVFAKDGNMFVTVGERGEFKGTNNARVLASSYGKVIRLRPDGTIPSDNPHVGEGGGVLPEIYSRGHRNPQGAALHPKTGMLWTIEHGAQGGDELNIIRPGKDYGWPDVTYGEDYGGAPIGVTSMAGVEQPAYFWDPVIAPSGLAFYDRPTFPAWRGSIFAGSMGQTHLVRLTVDGEKIVGEERLLVGGGRIRDVRVGPAGTIFVSNETTGKVLELVPK